MNVYARILAGIFACLALLISPVTRADTMFSLHLGFDSHSAHAGYHESFWPDNYQYAYWPFFYSPEFFVSYRPYSFIYYPSYYHSFYYYRPIVPFYYTYFYPWYYYPRHGHHYYGHNRHYAPYHYRQHKHHQQNHQQHHEYRKDNDATTVRQYSSVSVYNRSAPVTNITRKPARYTATGNVVMDPGFRNKDGNAPADRNIKIFSRSGTGTAPRRTFSPAAESGHVLGGNKNFQSKTFTRARDVKYIPSSTATARRGGHESQHRASPPVTRNYHGPASEHRASPQRRTEPGFQQNSQRQTRVISQSTSRGENSSGRQQRQSSIRPDGRRNNQGEATGFGNSRRTDARGNIR